MKILQTERLVLRHADLNDTPFIFDLLTDKTFIDNIADKGVKGLDDAKKYIQESLLASYEKNGFGLFIAEQISDGALVGVCGLVSRDDFADPDVGYAFLPQYAGIGYATESAKAVLHWAKDVKGILRVIGITGPENQGSIKVLEKIGLVRDKLIDYNGESTLLFVPKI